jgi:cytochrome P450
MSAEEGINLLQALSSFPFRQNRAADALIPVTQPVSHHEAKVYRVKLPTGQWAWLVSSHEGVREVLGNPAFSANVRLPGFPLLQPLVDLPESRRAGLFSRTDAPEHTRFRNFLASEFTLRAVKSHAPMIRRAIANSLDGMGKHEPPADLIMHFAQRVPSTVICEMLGVRHDDHLLFERCTNDLQSLTTSPARAAAAADDLRSYLAEVITARLSDGRCDSLIGRLAVHHVAAGHMTVAELSGALTLLLVAGHESTADALGLSAFFLLRHRELFRVLLDRPALAGSLVEELLRFLTPQRAGLRRVALGDAVVDGQQIRAGEGVIAMTPAANRDPEVFSEPDEFQVTRTARRHLSFGFGAHHCIGHHLARAEMELALVQMAHRFPRLALAVNPADVPVRYDGVVFGLDELLVSW